MHYGATSICQLPSCNLFTQHAIFYGETPLVNLCTPVHIPTLINNPLQFSALYFTASILYFHTIHLTFVFSKTGEIDNLTVPLGQSILVVLCAGSTLLLTPVKRQPPPSVAATFWRLAFSYWIDNLGFIIEGKLLAVLITPSSWGFPTRHLRV